MDDPKKRKDFTQEIDEKIPKLIQSVKNNPSAFQNSIETLLFLEKKTRLANDVTSSKKLASTILQICFDLKDFKSLGQYTSILCKRHAQLKQVVVQVIQLTMKYLEFVSDISVKIDLIEIMRDVSKGKMHVELEYARMSRILANIKEKSGDLDCAAEIMQEIQVETLGTMEYDEKVDFLLEQFRLTLDTNDFVRAELASSKISDKKLASDKKYVDMKIRYYKLLIRFYLHNESFFDVCKSYLEIYNVNSTLSRDWKEPLKKAIIYVSLSTFNDQVDQLRHHILKEKKISDNHLSNYKKLLELLTTNRIINWPLSFENQFKTDSIFNTDNTFNKSRWNLFKKSIVQHNLRVIAKFYQKIELKRLAFLLKLETNDCEEYLSEMVQLNMIKALIDRPEGVVIFQKKQNVDDILNVWANDISDLLSKIDKTCHLIAKENMVHGIA